MYRIFIDGQAGTTGLLLNQYLSARTDIEILEIDEAERKNEQAKYDLISASDVVVLCLPDEAAKQTVRFAANTRARMLDASSAHRVADGWAYGLPELMPGQRAEISSARFVSNPGCYPTGFLLALRPLVQGGLLRADSDIVISALSGYTGGGRQMVADYEARLETHPAELWHVRPYALDMNHKHLPEMHRYSGLDNAHMFLPYVAHFDRGMLVSVPLSARWFTRKATLATVYETLIEAYRDEPCINVHEPNDQTVLDKGKLEPMANNGTNRVDLFIYGNDVQMVLIARLDNLGKGAAGAAVQNLNLMLGVNELSGIETGGK